MNYPCAICVRVNLGRDGEPCMASCNDYCQYIEYLNSQHSHWLIPAENTNKEYWDGLIKRVDEMSDEEFEKLAEECEEEETEKK